VVRHDEADGHLQPVVGQPPVDPRARVLFAQEVTPLQLGYVGLFQVAEADGVLLGRVEQDLLDLARVVAVAHGQHHFLEDEGQVAGVVVDRLVEDDRIRDRHHAAGVLAAPDPDRGGIGLLALGLAHLHDRGLQEAERHDVAAHAADDDAVADVEDAAAQHQEVAGDRGDHPLHGDRDAGGDQPYGRGQPARVVEPDRHHPQDDHDGHEQAHRLAGPEGDPARGEAACGPADAFGQHPADQGRQDQERERQGQLAAVPGRHPDESDAEHLQRPVRAGEVRHPRSAPARPGERAGRGWVRSGLSPSKPGPAASRRTG
jgi:hypothetical protein